MIWHRLIRIRTKMSRIRNTGFQKFEPHIKIYQLFHLLGTDTDPDQPDPDRQALNTDPDPDPSKLSGSGSSTLPFLISCPDLSNLRLREN